MNNQQDKWSVTQERQFEADWLAQSGKTQKILVIKQEQKFNWKLFWTYFFVIWMVMILISTTFSLIDIVVAKKSTPKEWFALKRKSKNNK
jgi:hypothetical protein